MELGIRAHILPPPARRREATFERPIVSSRSNYLSLAPRIVSLHDEQFDDDGPGTLATAGPRHDNDFINVRDIRILPTTDEILSSRLPYMPYKRFNQPHFLPRGPERLLDTLFRQLRHENIEILKDCVYAAAQKLVSTASPPLDYDPSQETLSGNRHYLFWDARFEELVFHNRKGLIVRMSYQCPKSLRGKKIHNTKRFESGMLVALVGLDDDGVSLSVTFFEAYMCQSTESMNPRGGQGMRASVQLLFAQRDNMDDIRRIVYYSQGLSSGRFVLVEFPRHLLVGFYPILKRLQNFEPTDLAFTRYYAPRSQSEENVGLFPPSYALRDSATLDFSSITPREFGSTAPNLPLAPLLKDRKKFLSLVRKHTALDDGQATAFVESMGNEMAFVQGPPGTGKTYIGASLAKAILSIQDSPRRPILAVCMTNHALDSFLGDLVGRGVKKIARIGGGSREEWTKKYNLKNLASKVKTTALEQQRRSREYSKVKFLVADGTDLCEAANSPGKLGWYTVSKLLKERYKDVYDQLLIAARSDDHLHQSGFTANASAFPFAFWSSGGDLGVFESKLTVDFASFLGQNNPGKDNTHSNSDIIASVLKDVVHQMREKCKSTQNNIWLLSHQERQLLLRKWASEINKQSVADQIVDIHLEHHDAVHQLSLCHREVDVRCLQNQQVIGLTTTACATHWEMLNRLDLRVVICEEAAEVMEAHTLCTLFPSVEHAIFIGDPLQLRPQVAEQALSVETKPGSYYRLDESLFERLMDPQWGITTMPCSKLNVQRRMHPEISMIAKCTLYPYLMDHRSTKHHPAVSGLVDRTYWFDHDVPEDQLSAAATKSYSNMFEASMVVGLVNNLIKNHSYGLGDIAVLTPYNGQLAQLVRHLHSIGDVWLSEKDKEALFDDGLLPEEALETNGRVQIDIADMLRVSTIDNFQGEEAKVVILSTVRSNPDRRPGFLRSVNRINVACSRARDGFYVFGSARSLEAVPMWKTIIDLFRQANRLGSCLEIQPCPRNPEHFSECVKVRNPSDFDQLIPCAQTCNQPLSCGHICRQSCHPIELHGTEGMKCKERCSKTYSECGHPCQGACGDECGPCTAEVDVVTLSCGHRCQLTCTEKQSDIIPSCDALIETLTLDCGHTRDVRCAAVGKNHSCNSNCDFVLPCGHNCRGKCLDCQESGHSPCLKKCDVQLPCGHQCGVDCHAGGSCPPCQKPCSKRCEHYQCRNKCGEPCEPCPKASQKGCTHRGYVTTLCSLPSGLELCNELCESKLDCGHFATTICGEEPPIMCIECNNDTRPPRPQISLTCTHSVDVEDLDQRMKMYYSLLGSRNENTSSSTNIDKLIDVKPACPICNAILGDLRRYSDMAGLHDLQNTVERVLSRAGRAIATLTRRVCYHEELLFDSFEILCQGIRPTPLSAPANRRLIQDRASGLAEVQAHILETKENFIQPFEASLPELGRRLGKGSPIKETNLHFVLRLDLLFYRCRSAFLRDVTRTSEFLMELDDPSYQTRILAESLRRTAIVHGKENLEGLHGLIAACNAKLLKCLETEARLLQLNFYCLVMRALKLNSRGGKDLLDGSTEVNGRDTLGNSKLDLPKTLDIKGSLDRIFSLCRRYPHSAGQYIQQATSMKEAALVNYKIERIFTTQAREIDIAWGKRLPCSLASCENLHVYPRTLPSCPECGPEKLDEMDIDYEKFMMEDKFLERMRELAVKAEA